MGVVWLMLGICRSFYFFGCFALVVCLTSLVCGGEYVEPIREEVLVGDIDGGTALVVSPDGRVFYAEQTGAIRVWKDERLLAQPALNLADRLDTYWERGLIGMTLHPDFPVTPWFYVVYVAKAPYTHHVVSRFTMLGDWVDPVSERVLLEGDDQATLGGHVPAGHQGGPIVFGNDGMLYIGLGEQTAGEPSQALNTLQGKILRIKPDGSIPEDNPFYHQTKGKYRSIWAHGIRNPFGLAVEPGSGRLFCTDVGGSAFEEINEIVTGHNYGWPKAEGFSDDPKFTNPLHAYPPTVGRCISGALFYPASDSVGNRPFLLPDVWRGRFFFVDWASHWIKAMDPDKPEDVRHFGRGLNAPVAIQAADDGSLLVLNRGTIWRDGKKYQEKSGSLVRLRYLSDGVVHSKNRPDEVTFPDALAETGYFDTEQPDHPNEAFKSFEIALPRWEPGVQSRYWISLSDGASFVFDKVNQWGLPRAAVVIRNIYQSNRLSRPFETHLIQGHDNGRVAAAAYRWDTGGTDARLVKSAVVSDLKGVPERQWFTPGIEQNLDLNSVVMGFHLPLRARQLNVMVEAPNGESVSQLKLWGERGWLSSAPSEADLQKLPELVALDAIEANLTARVRSYLDVNCSHCHQPGGLSRGQFDARITTRLEDQGLVNGPLIAGDMGIEDARLVKPGHPEASILLERLKRKDFFRMPPVVMHDVESPLIPVLEAWIEGGME